MAIAGFLLFLFVVYLLARDDFVFLRRNITLDHIFDTIFFTTLVTLLISRTVYVLLHIKAAYLNPLVFFLIPYFPGLSLSGALIGGSLFALLYLNYYKNPTARMLDIFSISFLFAYCLVEGVSGGIFLVHKQFIQGGVAMGVVFFGLVIAILCKRFFSLSTWRDGGVSLFILSALSVLAISAQLFLIATAKHVIFDYEIIIFLVFLLGLGVVGLLRIRGGK